MKRNKNIPDIPSLIKSFLLEHLVNNQNASPNTVIAYKEVMRLLLIYLQDHHRVRPEKIQLKDLSVKNVLGFLDHLQKERKNSTSTRNTRLATIRSFVNYLLLVNPTWSADLRGILAIPLKKTNKTLLEYLTQDEMKALLEVPDSNTWIGQRDRLLLLLLYNTGARASEISTLKVEDVDLESKSGKVRLFGKGRKERAVLLWKNTIKLLRQWIEKNKYSGNMPLLASNRGTPLSRFVIANRLSVAVTKVPGLKKRKISPHTIRHTTAMHFLQSGIDITTIAMWLGHESVETTQLYVTADLEMKEKALKTLQEPNVKRFRYKPSDSLLAFLENL